MYTSNRKHTMTEHDITEIADARYMGLMCPPASPEAKALVADIINIIEQAEQRQRALKGYLAKLSVDRPASFISKDPRALPINTLRADIDRPACPMFAKDSRFHYASNTRPAHRNFEQPLRAT